MITFARASGLFLLGLLSCQADAEVSLDPVRWAQRADDATRVLPVQLELPNGELPMPRSDAAFEQAELWASFGERAKAVEMIGIMKGSGGGWATSTDFAFIYKRVGNNRLAQLAVDHPDDDFSLAEAVGAIGRAQFFTGEEKLGLEGMLWATEEAFKAIELRGEEDGTVYTLNDAAWVGGEAAYCLADAGFLDQAEQVIQKMTDTSLKAVLLVHVARWHLTVDNQEKAEALVKQAERIFDVEVKEVEKDAKLMKALVEADFDDVDPQTLNLHNDPWNIRDRQETRDGVRGQLAAWSIETGDAEASDRILASLETTTQNPWVYGFVFQAHTRAGKPADALAAWTKALEVLKELPPNSALYSGMDLGYAAAYAGNTGVELATQALEADGNESWRVGLIQGLADGLREAKLRETNLKEAD